MENKHAALITAAILNAGRGLGHDSTVAATKELAERLESWLDSRP